MLDILARLRVDAGQLTLAALIQERALAAHEIEKLRVKLDERGMRSASLPSLQFQTDSRVPQVAHGNSAHRSRVYSKGSSYEQPTVHFDRDALLRLKDVCLLFGLSRSTIYKRVSEKSFPQPMRISERSVRWRMSDLTQWSSELVRRG